MTKQQLQKIIQEAVRKEVKKQMNEIFIKEETSSKLIDIAPDVSEPKEEIQYTKNTSLNKVLNETVGLSKSQKEFEEYPTLGDGTFDRSKMTELLGYGKSEEVKRNMVAVDTLQKAGKSVNDVPEHITKALTKDYSKLMKVMNKKG